MKFFILFLFCFFVNQCYTQTIKGNVYDDKGPIAFANILIKKTTNPDLIYQFARANENGNFSISLKEPQDSLLIEVNSYEYETVYKKVRFVLEKDKIITLNFKLNPSIIKLKEVIIGDDKPIKVKKDTIVYDPNKFKNGSEKVVEDLLRKLPGIEVEDNGQIKFKGKTIKKLLLDGDDLFDSQYTIGSKNIDVDIVDKVEAIENYQENILLKGLTSNDEVAINLKLKKGKSDFSGNANLGLGIEKKQNLTITGILLNSKNKSFIVSSFNNTGINNTPYDFNSTSISLESLSEQKLKASELINQGQFYSPLEDKLHRINNNFYTSLNTLYKLNLKTSLKLNLGIYTDKLSRFNKQETYYTINNEVFTNSQTENAVKSPELYNANIQLNKNVSKTLNWEYLGKFNVQKVDYKSVSYNNEVRQTNNVNTKNWFTKQNLNLTKRINDNSAITSSTFYSNSSAPQKYNLAPGISIDSTVSTNIKESNQESRFSKEILRSNTQFLTKFSNFKLAVHAGFYYEKNKFISFLETINSDNIPSTDLNFQNDLVYKYSLSYINSDITYKKDAFAAKLGIGTQYFKFKNNIDGNQNNTIINPSLKLLYRFSRHTNLVSTYSFNQVAPEETNLFEGFVQTGFGSFRNNEANMQFLKTHNYSINFNYGDSFYLTNMSLGFNYNHRNNNYFYKNYINPDYVITTSFMLNSGNENYNFNFKGEKFIRSLNSNFKLKSNYSISLNKNIVNNSDLRDIKSKYFTIELTTNTPIVKNMFIENNISYSSNKIMVQGNNSNTFSTLKNSFKTVLKLTDRFKGNLTTQFIIPDLTMNTNYLFLDCEITFTSKNKKFDYSIIGRNLTNNKTFETINISDYSKSIASYNLINRFFLASIAFKF